MLRRLEMAIAIDTHRSFHRAAKALGISQPSLTRALQVLEGEMGARLFERGKSECEPTTFGRMVLARARRIVSEVAESKREIGLLQDLEIGEFVIGTGSASVQHWVGSAIGEICATHRHLKVRTLEYPWYRLPDALMSSEVDVAVGDASELDGNSDIVVSRLPRRPIGVVCRSDHPLARAGKVDVEDLARFPLAGPPLTRRTGMYFPAESALGSMQESARYFTPAILCPAWDAIREIVRHSDAVAMRPLALLQASQNRSELAILPFEAPWLCTEFAIMWRRDRVLHPALKAFRDATRRSEAEVPAIKEPPRAVA